MDVISYCDCTLSNCRWTKACDLKLSVSAKRGRISHSSSSSHHNHADRYTPPFPATLALRRSITPPKGMGSRNDSLTLHAKLLSDLLQFLKIDPAGHAVVGHAAQQKVFQEAAPLVTLPSGFKTVYKTSQRFSSFITEQSVNGDHIKNHKRLGPSRSSSETDPDESGSWSMCTWC